MIGLAPTSVGAAEASGPIEPNAALASSGAPIGSTRLLSVRFDGSQTLRRSNNPAVSAQGQFVAFSSRARIVQGSANLATRQMFLRDMSTGISTLLSRGRDGGGGDGNSDWPSISADGTRIVFSSDSTNLVRGDTNGYNDIFMYDTISGATTLISHAPNGNPANRASYSPSISADGTHVVFTSSATNLGPDNGYVDSVYIYDIAAGSAQLVTHTPDGSPTNYYGGYNPQISGDGNLVTYYSPTADLVADDTNSHDDVFLYNATQDTNRLISRAPNGTLANGNSYGVDISADGTHVAYNSHATNLAPNDDTANITDVFVYDVATKSTTLISRATDGGPGNRDSYYPSISGDGTLIAYTSYASDLVRNDANAGSDIFVHNIATGTTRLISKAPDGAAATGNSDRADISVDGTHIGYESEANNLVTPDTDTGRHVSDVFLYRLS